MVTRPRDHGQCGPTKDGKFLIISMRLMIDGLYDLTYWRVWEHLERDHGSEGPRLRDTFTQFYGQVLERYVFKLLQSEYDTPNTKRVFAEGEAQPPQGAPDVAIFLDDRVILVDALQLARWLRPNLMLIDPDLLSFRSAELARALATALPEVRLVLLTASTAT